MCLEACCKKGWGDGRSNAQREGMGLIKYQPMSFLRDVAYGGVLCTFSNRSSPDWDKWCGPSGQVGHSPPGSQAGRRVVPAL